MGNQLFEYVYYLYLKRMFPNDRFYSFLNQKRLDLHNGFELTKWFAVNLPSESGFVTSLMYFLFHVNRVLRKLHVPLLGVSDDSHLNERKILHEGWYQDKKYFKLVGAPEFREDLFLGEENERLLTQIKTSNSVSVHIRRGDYLLSRNANVGGVCNAEYYRKALDKIKSMVHNPKFFFFSDDPKYVRQTYGELNIIVVDCNIGEKSFFDVYLMSHCKHMIIANSTFSCWAAYFNKHAENIICPSVWNKKNNPDLLLENWIAISKD